MRLFAIAMMVMTLSACNQPDPKTSSDLTFQSVGSLFLLTSSVRVYLLNSNCLIMPYAVEGASWRTIGVATFSPHSFRVPVLVCGGGWDRRNYGLRYVSGVVPDSWKLESIRQEESGLGKANQIHLRFSSPLSVDGTPESGSAGDSYRVMEMIVLYRCFDIERNFVEFSRWVEADRFGMVSQTYYERLPGESDIVFGQRRYYDASWRAFGTYTVVELDGAPSHAVSFDLRRLFGKEDRSDADIKDARTIAFSLRVIQPKAPLPSR